MHEQESCIRFCIILYTKLYETLTGDLDIFDQPLNDAIFTTL